MVEIATRNYIYSSQSYNHGALNVISTLPLRHSFYFIDPLIPIIDEFLIAVERAWKSKEEKWREKRNETSEWYRRA